MSRHLLNAITARPRRALIITFVFVALAAVFGSSVSGALDESGGFAPEDSGSAQAERIIEHATGTEAGPGVLLLVDSTDTAKLNALEQRLAAIPGIASTAGPSDDPALVASDGRTAIVGGTLSAKADEADVAKAALSRFEDDPGVTLGGSAISEHQIDERIGSDLGRAEMFAFPILLVLSLLFFRRRAALLPLAVGVTTVFSTFLALRGINEAYSLSVFALNLVIGLGLGLAIDYTLFLVTRFREELERDVEDVKGAISRTMQTAGRTVVFSAATVAAALITLTLFPMGFLKSMGVAGAVVAVVAAAAALVITPALFALWGRKLLLQRKPRDGQLWYRLSHAVMRRPGTVAIATAAVMLLAAFPALRTQFTPVDATAIPKADSSRTVADAMDRDYDRLQSEPVTLAIEAPRSDAAEVTAFAKELRSIGGVSSVSPPRALDAKTWDINLTVDGPPSGDVAQQVVHDARAIGTPFPVSVGGAAAEFVDQQDGISSRLPYALALLALLTFLVLWAMTGSVVLPIKAIIMNALTVGSALGLLTLIYQDGRFEDFLGYTSNGGIEPSDFLVTSALVFALSTDYGVFLLGRIKEARDAGASEREAIAIGLQRTGRVVTAAAILLAVAIGAFATSSISFIQQIGIATAAGVLLDAFVVRALLVPALMGLMGKWNWWAPMGLRRLHDRVAPAHG